MMKNTKETGCQRNKLGESRLVWADFLEKVAFGREGKSPAGRWGRDSQVGAASTNTPRRRPWVCLRNCTGRIWKARWRSQGQNHPREDLSFLFEGNQDP